MRNRSLFLVVLVLITASLHAAGVSPMSSVRGSGNLETRQFALDDFTGVDVGYAFVVSVREGSSYRVEVTTDDNIFEFLDLHVTRGTLRAGLQPRTRINATEVEIDIVLPALERIQLSGATRGEIAVDRGDRQFEADLSGASALTGRVRAGTLYLDASGASRIELQGAGRAVIADVSGASRMRLFELPVEIAELEVSGASTAEVNVSQSLEADASGASTVRYSGDPGDVRTDTSGGSQLQKR